MAALPWHLALAGRGSAEQRLRAQVRRLGLDDRVTFCGFVDAVHDWLGAIDIFVLPSLIEGFGYVLAEAGAAGKPSVLGVRSECRKFETFGSRISSLFRI